MTRLLRPRGSDDLGLRRALSDRLLPLLVAAMTFLASLALAGAIAASSLARHWQGGAASLMTVQVPDPGAASALPAKTRADAASFALQAMPGVAARRLGQAELMAVLQPWLGAASTNLALDLPAMFELKLAPGTDPRALAQRLTQAAPGTIVEQNSLWSDRLAVLGRSLWASAALSLLVVTLVAVALVAVATRAGLAARRESIEIVHGLGATDRMIAGRFATRVTLLVSFGSILGLILAVPLLLALATLSAPFENAPAPTDARALLGLLPVTLWAILPALPVAAAAIGWVTAQATVRGWLGGLP
jgi:cell division transport system permease protein